jgi:hypothetical protein
MITVVDRCLVLVNTRSHGEGTSHKSITLARVDVYRRVSPSGKTGPLCRSHLPLPELQPPTDGLVALLRISPLAHLHQSTPMTLIVRNRHPSRSAHVVVTVDVDVKDSLIFSGMRSGYAPVLLPGSEWESRWTLIPLECGHVRLPRIRVTDRRKPFVASSDPNNPSAHNPETDLPGDEVKIIDVRWDRRNGEGQDVMLQRRNSIDSEASDEETAPGHIGTILVLP